MYINISKKKVFINCNKIKKKQSRNVYLKPNVSGEFLPFSMEKFVKKKKEKKVAPLKFRKQHYNFFLFQWNITMLSVAF